MILPDPDKEALMAGLPGWMLQNYCQIFFDWYRLFKMEDFFIRGVGDKGKVIIFATAKTTWWL